MWNFCNCLGKYFPYRADCYDFIIFYSDKFHHFSNMDDINGKSVKKSINFNQSLFFFNLKPNPNRYFFEKPLNHVLRSIDN